jgi:Putative transposase
LPPGLFLSVKVLSRLFRRLFLEGLRTVFSADRLEFHGALESLKPQFQSWINDLAAVEWVVYAKPPFGGPLQVIEYLGRYTHRVAISNQRLLALEAPASPFSTRIIVSPAKPNAEK